MNSPAKATRKSAKTAPSRRHEALGPNQAAPKAAPAKLGQRQTRQRGVIAAILEAAPGPLTIPEIHQQALKAQPGSNVGIATVYRTLNLLVENGRAQLVILPSGDTRYEAAGHKGHHDHFQCKACGKVFDIDICLLGLAHGAVLPGGYRVEGHELTLTGTCPECAAKPAKRGR